MCSRNLIKGSLYQTQQNKSVLLAPISQKEKLMMTSDRGKLLCRYILMLCDIFAIDVRMHFLSLLRKHKIIFYKFFIFERDEHSQKLHLPKAARNSPKWNSFNIYLPADGFFNYGRNRISPEPGSRVHFDLRMSALEKGPSSHHILSWRLSIRPFLAEILYNSILTLKL